MSNLLEAAKAVKEKDGEPAFEFTEHPDGTASLFFNSDKRLTTTDEVLDFAGVDRKIWQVAGVTIKTWDVTMKMGTAATGHYPTRKLNYGITVKLERIAPKHVIEAMREFFQQFRSHVPKAPRVGKPKTKDPHMLEVALFDAHFGKLCWGAEVGADYDTKIAETVYLNAVDDLLQLTSGYNIERVVFPIGQDFFHVDSWSGPARNATTRGTPQDVDGRFQKVIQIGTKAVIEAIERCMQVAPVDVLWIPGNHDRQTSFMMALAVEQRFWRTAGVTVDVSPAKRKRIVYGPALIGLTHGEEFRKGAKGLALPLSLATTWPKEWAAATVREIHTGHWHAKREVEYISTSEEQGVRIRTLPSLSGTDEWHFDNLFVNSIRAAEAYLWSKSNGYVGHFSAYAREDD